MASSPSTYPSRSYVASAFFDDFYTLGAPEITGSVPKHFRRPVLALSGAFHIEYAGAFTVLNDKNAKNGSKSTPHLEAHIG